MKSWRRSDIALVVLAGAALAAFLLRPRAPQAQAVAVEAAPRSLPRLVLRREGPMPAPPASQEDCQTRLVELQREMTAVDRKITRRRSPIEVFDQSTPDAALTIELAPVMARALGSVGNPATDVQLECRGPICCARALQGRNLTRSFDPFFEILREQKRLKGGQSWRNPGETCFGVRRQDDPPEAFDLAGEAVGKLRRSGAIERCQASHRGVGTLETRINLVGDEGELEDAPLGVSVRTGGKLDGTPLGDCIAAELRRTLGELQLPADFETGVLFATFPKP